MRVDLSRFGKLLISRPAGRESFEAFRSYLAATQDQEVELIFDGVASIGPSWLDEFVTRLRDAGYRVTYGPTTNASALKSIQVIEQSED